MELTWNYAMAYVTADRHRTLFIILSVATALALAAFVVSLGPPAIMAPWDVFILLDGSWRIFNGQIPHTDFYNPIGSLTYIFGAIAMKFSSHPAFVSLVYGNLLFLSLVVALTLLVSRKRLTGLHVFVLVAFLALLTVAPRPLGYDPSITSYGMIYNRYGWILFGLLAVQLFIRPRDPPQIRWDGALAGVLLGLIFFCKVSYFIMALPAIGLAMLLRPEMWRSCLPALIGFCAVAGLMWLFYGISTFNYLHDISLAGEAQSLSMRFRLIIEALGWNRRAIALLFGLAGLVTALRGRATFWLRYRPLIVAFFLAGAAILLSAGNNGEKGDVPLFFVSGLVMCQLLLDGTDRESVRLAPRRFLILYGIALAVTVAYLGGRIFYRDARSYAYELAYVSAKHTAAPHSQFFDAAPIRDFYIPANSEWQTAYWRAKEVPDRINEGIALLRRSMTPGQKVFAVALTNPFSFALHLGAPRGAPLWWDLGYSFNRRSYPAPKTVFSHVDLVIVPVLNNNDDGCCQSTVRALLDIYGHYLHQHFIETARSQNWIVMRRKAEVPGSPFAC